MKLENLHYSSVLGLIRNVNSVDNRGGVTFLESSCTTHTLQFCTTLLFAFILLKASFERGLFFPELRSCDVLSKTSQLLCASSLS